MKVATAREGKAKGSKDERTGQEKKERTGHTHSMQGRSPWRRQGRAEVLTINSCDKGSMENYESVSA